MAQTLVRDIPDEVFDRFKRKAKEQGKSTEAFVRELIIREARSSRESLIAEIDGLRALSTPSPAVDSTRVIREARDRGYMGD